MENNLKKIRLGKQISINECVRKTGIPKQTLKRYERGETTIGMEHLLTLSRFYEIPLDKMFEQKEKMSLEQSDN